MKLKGHPKREAGQQWGQRKQVNQFPSSSQAVRRSRYGSFRPVKWAWQRLKLLPMWETDLALEGLNIVISRIFTSIHSLHGRRFPFSTDDIVRIVRTSSLRALEHRDVVRKLPDRRCRRSLSGQQTCAMRDMRSATGYTGNRCLRTSADG